MGTCCLRSRMDGFRRGLLVKVCLKAACRRDLTNLNRSQLWLPTTSASAASVRQGQRSSKEPGTSIQQQHHPSCQPEPTSESERTGILQQVRSAPAQAPQRRTYAKSERTDSSSTFCSEHRWSRQDGRNERHDWIGRQVSIGGGWTGWLRRGQ
jgi:hypothetical protein